MGKFETYPETNVLNDNDITLYNHNGLTNKITFSSLVSLIRSKLEALGFVSSISAGVGLSGGTITSSGTIKCKLQSEEPSSLQSTTISTTTNRQYAVGLDSQGNLSVNVPWVQGSVYQQGDGIIINDNTISVNLDNSHSSSSTTRAATANSVKDTYDDSLRRNGSNAIADFGLSGSLTVGNRLDGSIIGVNSTSEGTNNTVSGEASHAEGANNIVNRDWSHAEGGQNTISSDYSHAEGYSNTVTKNYSHAEGNSNQANGVGSHVEGENNKSYGVNSHVEGSNNTTNGASSHAEGMGNTTNGTSSHAEGTNNTVSGTGSHVEGSSNTASSNYSHAEGNNSQAVATASHAEGMRTYATGSYSHTEGTRTRTAGNASHSEGNGTSSVGYDENTVPSEYIFALYSINSHGNGAHTEGYTSYDSQSEISGYIQANGNGSHAEGCAEGGQDNAMIIASGKGSHAEGYADCLSTGGENYIIASGLGSHAEGTNTTAEGDFSHAEGFGASASNTASHAEGYNTTAIGIGSHAEGCLSTARGNYSHAGGYDITTSLVSQFIQGGYNYKFNSSTNKRGAFGIQPDGLQYTANDTVDSKYGRGGTILGGVDLKLQLDNCAMYLLVCTSYGSQLNNSIELISTAKTSSGTPLSTYLSPASFTTPMANNIIEISDSDDILFHLIRII